MRGRAKVEIRKQSNKAMPPHEATNQSPARNLHRKADQYIAQARRLGHMAARAKKLAANTLTEEHRGMLAQHNLDTHRALLSQEDSQDDDEQTMVQNIRNHDPCTHQAYAIFKRSELWFTAKHDATRAEAHAASRQERKAGFDDKKKGIRNLSSAISKPPSRPLLHAKRTKIGASGQPIGSYTTNPAEVDSIAKEAWQQIYQSNVEDMAAAVTNFVCKYGAFIFTSAPWTVSPKLGDEVRDVCIHGKKTAAGMDKWEPAELALLSDELFEMVAMLLNTIEEGAPWPDGTLHARAAYLSKDPNRMDDPLAFRVLLILAILYRKWGP